MIPDQVYFDWLIWMLVIKFISLVRVLIDSAMPFELENAFGFCSASNEWLMFFIVNAITAQP
jgi:hypothetical protein